MRYIYFHGPDHDQLGIELRIRPIQQIGQYYLASFGCGIGGGSSNELVKSLNISDLIISMHVFPLQCLFDFGWLYIIGLVYVVAVLKRRKAPAPMIVYILCVLILTPLTDSSGAITNYFFFGCVSYLVALVATQSRLERKII